MAKLNSRRFFQRVLTEIKYSFPSTWTIIWVCLDYLSSSLNCSFLVSSISAGINELDCHEKCSLQKIILKTIDWGSMPHVYKIKLGLKNCNALVCLLLKLHWYLSGIKTVLSHRTSSNWSTSSYWLFGLPWLPEQCCSCERFCFLNGWTESRQFICSRS